MPSTTDLIAARNARRAARSKGQRTKSAPPLAIKGVGDHLTDIIQEKTGKPPCATHCKATAAKMNEWGPSKCRDESGDLAKEIHENVKRMKWTDSIQAPALKAADAVIALRGLELYERMVHDACNRADPPVGPGTIVINANKHGFGDAMVTAWISEGSKGTDRPLVHHATDSKAVLLRAFGQEVIESPQENMRDTHKPGGTESAGMRISRLAHRHEYLQADGEPRRPIVSEIPQDVQKWADGIATDKTVILFPQAAHDIRIWPKPYWMELYRLLEERGWKPIINLDLPDNDYRKFEKLTSVSWLHVLALIQRSALVITNSSGPAHVAGTMGHPTLVLCGPTNPDVAFGHLPELNCLFEESMPCVRCHYRPPDCRPSCWTGCEALNRLSPRTVYDEALRMLETEHLQEVFPGYWRQTGLGRIEYDDAYFGKYVDMANSVTDIWIKSARTNLVRSHGCKTVLDVGIGCGAFIETFQQSGNPELGQIAEGYDVMPAAVMWLMQHNCYRSPYEMAGKLPDAITCWDSIEHTEDPRELLDCVKPGMYLFASLPIWDSQAMADTVVFEGDQPPQDPEHVAPEVDWKHFRHGEHLHYWTDQGFKTYCAQSGLVCVESNRMETDLGREDIGTYVFKRPDAVVGNTAYVVAGPVSSGNRLLASILVRSGCAGNADTTQPKVVDDIPQAEGPFVTIRHGYLDEWIPALRSKGYERVVVIVIIREPSAQLDSAHRRGHKKVNPQERARCITHAATDALEGGADLEFVTYEGLNEDALKVWLPTIGLPYVGGELGLGGQDGPKSIANMNGGHYG